MKQLNFGNFQEELSTFRCQAQCLAFLPLAVDVLGGWHKEGLATLSKLGGQLARALGKPEGKVVAHLRQRVGWCW